MAKDVLECPDCGFSDAKRADLAALIDNELTIAQLGGSDGAEPRRASPSERDRRLTLGFESRKWQACPEQGLHAEMVAKPVRDAAEEKDAQEEADVQAAESTAVPSGPTDAGVPAQPGDGDVADAQAGVDASGDAAPAPEAPEASASSVDPDPEDARVTELLKLTKEELVAQAETSGLDTSGTKADIAARIVDREFPERPKLFGVF